MPFEKSKARFRTHFESAGNPGNPETLVAVRDF
jgi:hypothetical protein